MLAYLILVHPLQILISVDLARLKHSHVLDSILQKLGQCNSHLLLCQGQPLVDLRVSSDRNRSKEHDLWSDNMNKK
jgi:hypothetical protein